MDILKQKIRTVKDRLKEEFLADNRPWVVTFSGGKDSTTVLHLVIEMLLEMKQEQKVPTKQLYVGNKLQQIEEFAKKAKLNISINLLKPKVTDSFWTLLLGKENCQPRRRNGQKSIGPFKLQTRKELLEKLLQTEQKLKKELAGKHLISDEEIVQIQTEWLNDGDFFESAIKLAKQYGRDVAYKSVKAFNKGEQEFIEDLCQENGINKELIDHIMQCEHSCRHHTIRVKALSEF